MYGFKTIPPVAPASDLTDIVLTRTQRKTPTVVRSGWDISRIREFYMRKVKFTQETLHEKLSTIVDSFPKLDVRAENGVVRARRSGCGVPGRDRTVGRPRSRVGPEIAGCAFSAPSTAAHPALSRPLAPHRTSTRFTRT